MDERNGLISSSRYRSSTPAFDAASYMLSSKMSHPVKTRSLSPASGTNSFTFGERPSVRFPNRIVPIWVSDPIGFASPLRIASTPATNVVATAPMPGIMMPSFPFAGSMLEPPALWAADFTSTLDVFFVVTRFCLVAIVRVSPYEFCGIGATRYRLVLCTDLQPTRPEWFHEASEAFHKPAQRFQPLLLRASQCPVVNAFDL